MNFVFYKIFFINL